MDPQEIQQTHDDIEIGTNLIEKHKRKRSYVMTDARREAFERMRKRGEEIRNERRRKSEEVDTKVEVHTDAATDAPRPKRKYTRRPKKTEEPPLDPIPETPSTPPYVVRFV